MTVTSEAISYDPVDCRDAVKLPAATDMLGEAAVDVAGVPPVNVHR